MPQENYDGKIERKTLSRLHSWEVLVRTKAYKEYEKRYRKKVKSYLLNLKQMEENLPDSAKDNYDVDYHLKKFFLLTDEGKAIAEHLKIDPLDKSCVAVIFIKCDKAGAKPLDIALLALREGRYLTLELDLWASQNELLSKVEWEIKRFTRHVIDLPLPPTRGPGKSTEEEIAAHFEVYDLVEFFLALGKNNHQSVVEATKKIESLEHPHPEDPRYQTVSRWHQEIKEEIERAESAGGNGS